MQPDQNSNQPTQQNQPQEEHKCVKCGKVIKAGTEFTHQGEVYCCGDCCKRPDKNAPVCEFC